MLKIFQFSVLIALLSLFPLFVWAISEPKITVYVAPWCQYCREEISQLNDFYFRYKDFVDIQAFNYDEGHSIQAVRSMGVDFPITATNPNPYLSINGLPTIIINCHGALSRLEGTQDIESLKRRLREVGCGLEN